MAPGEESKRRRGSALNKGTPGSGPAKSIDWAFPTPAAASVPEKGRHRHLVEQELVALVVHDDRHMTADNACVTVYSAREEQALYNDGGPKQRDTRATCFVIVCSFDIV
ncbi:hypothetical protein MTO96_008395 [Rhipicephalus appendiculatus]